MERFLAKSTGELLVEHSRKVSELAVYIVEQNLVGSTGDKDKMVDIVRKIGLLHDIGKCQSSFQSFLENPDKRRTKKDKIIYAHNEVGWAFVRKYMKWDFETLESISNGIYWHHGIFGSMQKYTDGTVLYEVRKKKDSSIENMKEYARTFFPDDVLEQENLSECTSPTFYVNDYTEGVDKNVENTFIRMCLVRADHLVSQFEISTLDDLKEIVDSQTKQKTPFIFKGCPYEDGKERWKEQVSIVSRTVSSDKVPAKTVQMNAPAGFGKTLTALIWSVYTKKKLIWVCPRNSVAHSVYYSIINELKNAGIKTSVELYYGGEQQDSHNSDGIKFTSDIIVTNIDNFLRPTKEHCNDIDLLLVSDADVVFDEYHELVSEGALMAGFVNMMRLRHNLTKGRTLLLSATPTELPSLWDNLWSKDWNSSTLHLPGKYSHAPAAHQKLYTIKTAEGRVDIPKNSPGPYLHVSNTVAECQKTKRRFFEDSFLFHSMFTDENKKENIKEILSLYGKNSDRSIKKDNVIASPIAQSSLDVSFRHGIDSVLSPESTIQRIGRLNRWGDYDGDTHVTCFRLPPSKEWQGENTMKDTLYTRTLSDSWFEFLKTHQGAFTLDRIYEFYNQHRKDKQEERSAWINQKYRESRKMLQNNIFPSRLLGSSSGSDVTILSGKSFRSTGYELFFTCRLYGQPKKYTPPKSARIYKSVSEDFNEDYDTLKKTIVVAKLLTQEPGNDKNYSKWLRTDKTKTLENLRFLARNKNTPYVRHDMVYHDVYGFIKTSVLESMYSNI